MLGHYGWQRWQDGQLTAPASPPGVDAARAALPGLLAEAGAADGTWIEDKTHAVAVHTRRAADPEAALARLRGPLGELARLGLAAEPGRFVIELRPPGVDKGAALTALVRERAARSVLFSAMTSATCPPSPRFGRCALAASPAARWPAPARNHRRSRPRLTSWSTARTASWPCSPRSRLT